MENKLMTTEAAEELQRERLNAIAAARAKDRIARTDARMQREQLVIRCAQEELRRTRGLFRALLAWACAGVTIFSALLAPWWTVPIPMLATLWLAVRAAADNR